MLTSVRRSSSRKRSIARTQPTISTPTKVTTLRNRFSRKIFQNSASCIRTRQAREKRADEKFVELAENICRCPRHSPFAGSAMPKSLEVAVHIVRPSAMLRMIAARARMQNASRTTAAPELPERALVGDHLAVVRQAGGRDQFDRRRAAWSPPAAWRRPPASSPAAGAAHSAFSVITSCSSARVNGEAQPANLRMTPADLRDLRRMHEHALDLGGLVGAAHPAGDAHVGAPARRASRHQHREVAGGEPDHRIIAD